MTGVKFGPFETERHPGNGDTLCRPDRPWRIVVAVDERINGQPIKRTQTGSVRLVEPIDSLRARAFTFRLPGRTRPSAVKFSGFRLFSAVQVSVRPEITYTPRRRTDIFVRRSRTHVSSLFLRVITPNRRRIDPKYILSIVFLALFGYFWSVTLVLELHSISHIIHAYTVLAQSRRSIPSSIFLFTFDSNTVYRPTEGDSF